MIVIRIMIRAQISSHMIPTQSKKTRYCFEKKHRSDPREWPTEVTHGSDPRWVTSAPGGPKNLLIVHHNNNAAVARSARRKKNSFWPGDASEDASFNFIVFVSSERWTLGQGNSWVIPANAPRRPWILLPSRRPFCTPMMTSWSLKILILLRKYSHF